MVNTRDDDNRPVAVPPKADADLPPAQLDTGQLHERNKLFQLVLDSTPDAIFAKDTAGRYTMINKAGARMVGKPPQEVVGKDDFELFPEHQAQTLREHDQHACKHGQPSVVIEHVTFAHGPGICETTKTPICSETGDLIGLVGVARDITTRLKRKDQRELALEAAAMGTWHWDLADKRVHLDDNLYTLLGLPPGTVSGTYDDITNYIAPEDRQRAWADIAIASEHLDTFEGRYRALLPDNSSRWLAFKAKACRDDNDTLYLVRGVAWDCTEAVEREQALHNTTAALQRANRSLRDFSYMATHDLQEPLRAIGHYAGELRESLSDQLDPTQAHQLDFVASTTARLQEVVRSLLSFCKADLGHVELTESPLDACVDQAVAALEQTIAQRCATLTRDPLPTLRCNPTLVAQVYQNLISNALKFVSPGTTPQLHLSAEHLENVWILGVRDNGIGIAAKQLNAVFNPFKRLHDRAVYAGTGMGLTICHKIIERHEGRIWCESEPEGGSWVKFQLWANAEPSQAD